MRHAKFQWAKVLAENERDNLGAIEPSEFSPEITLHLKNALSANGFTLKDAARVMGTPLTKQGDAYREEQITKWLQAEAARKERLALMKEVAAKMKARQTAAAGQPEAAVREAGPVLGE